MTVKAERIGSQATRSGNYCVAVLLLVFSLYAAWLSFAAYQLWMDQEVEQAVVLDDEPTNHRNRIMRAVRRLEP